MFSDRELEPQMSLFSFLEPEQDEDQEDEEFTQNM